MSTLGPLWNMPHVFGHHHVMDITQIESVQRNFAFLYYKEWLQLLSMETLESRRFTSRLVWPNNVQNIVRPFSQ